MVVLIGSNPVMAKEKDGGQPQAQPPAMRPGMMVFLNLVDFLFIGV
jgi:hypothetical protein